MEHFVDIGLYETAKRKTRGVLDMKTYDDELTASLQIARKAIPKMSQWKVPPTPNNYHVWYAYILGYNSQLAEEIDGLISSGKSFPRELNQELYERYFGKDRERRQLEQALGQTSRILKSVLDDILSTKDLASDYADKLKTYSSALDDASGISQIEHIITDMITDTNQVAATTNAIQHKFEQVSAEADNLREQLNTTAREALIDPLTGLNNRNALNKKLSELHKIFQEEKTPYSVIMVDIDLFKKLNDKYGHRVGDEVLQFIGTLLRDTLKGRDFPARYGGEEFLVVLPSTALDNTCIVAEEIRRRLSEKSLKHVKTGASLGKVTASLGVAQVAPDDTIDALLERADKALYLAKDSGRNTVKSENDINNQRTR